MFYSCITKIYVYICTQITTKLKQNIMRNLTPLQLANKLKEINDDYALGIYSVGEIYNLSEALTEVLKNKKFI